MIDRRGEPIIMDFGLARRLEASDTTRTGQGVVLGTPAYMAPEQARGDIEALGPGCDIHSLGVILFQLLVGKVPFKGTTMEVLAQHMRDEAALPSSLRPSLETCLDAICRKAMAKEPSQRFLSMAEFAQTLEAYVSGMLTADSRMDRDADPLVERAEIGACEVWDVIGARA